jgi:hypothetical protein
MKPLSPSTSAKLFLTGCTVGPIVDSLHNQCLLQYEKAPISIEYPSLMIDSIPSIADQGYDYLFCSSWTVPPLLGIAYLVLGGVLPRLFQFLLDSGFASQSINYTSSESQLKEIDSQILRNKAILAVSTTALIIKLSEFLETNPGVTDSMLSPYLVDQAQAHLIVMIVAALSQWAFLDGALSALLAAAVTGIGGPLSELPFVANHFWEYLPSAADYYPLQNINLPVLSSIMGDDYQSLALSSITGPCYFAVTMDAIALGRWFDRES